MIKDYPGFGQAYGYLAIVYNREWTYGFGQAADDPHALDTALRLVRRSVELNPDNARAWQMLSAVLFTRRDIAAAVAASEKAIALNPFDLIIATDYAGRLITTGEIDRGMTALKSIPSDGGIRPSWQHFYLFLADYMRGDMAEATHEADEITSDTFSFGLFARALIAGLNGNTEQMQSNWEKLTALRGAWRDDPRAQLERYISSPIILDRLMRDLTKIGLYRPH